MCDRTIMRSWGGKWALLLCCCLALAYCSPVEPPRASAPQLTAHTAVAAASGYEVQWGRTAIPLSAYANPKVYRGQAAVGLEEFHELLGQPISLSYLGDSLAFELVGIHRLPYRRFDPFGISFPDYSDSAGLAPEISDIFRSGIRPGDAIGLHLSAGDSTIIQFAQLYIKDPYQSYTPEVRVPEVRHTDDTYGFQVIQESGQRPILRVDTASGPTRHIYQLYEQNNTYRVVHIPGFKTARRLLTDRDQLFATQDIRRAEVLDTSLSDWMLLPELTGYEGLQARLDWGGMTASPESPPYHLWAFQSALGQEPRLLIGADSFRIYGFELTISGEASRPQLFAGTAVAAAPLQKVLWQTPPASSVYFNRLVVSRPGAPDQLLLFPQAFAFHIERLLPYELEISKGTAGQPRAMVGESWMKLENYPLRAALCWLLGLEEGQIDWQAVGPEPSMTVAFASKAYAPHTARELIAHELLQGNGLRMDWAAPPAQYVLEVADEALLKQFHNPEDSLQVYHNRYDHLVFALGADMDEVSGLLEEAFGKPVVNGTGQPTSMGFRVELDLGSVAACRKVLQRTGLRLRADYSCARLRVSPSHTAQ